MENILTNWDKVFQLLTILIATVAALFSYLSIRTSKKLSNEQIEFSKELNKQEIMLGRPLISCTGNIGILNETTFNLNVTLRNIGKRSLINLSIEYFCLSRSPSGSTLEFNENYSIANPLDNGSEYTFFEKLPRSNSQKEILYKIKINFKDTLTKSLETQEFYYIFPKEQQEYLDNKIKNTVGLFNATNGDKDFLNNNLK